MNMRSKRQLQELRDRRNKKNCALIIQCFLQFFFRLFSFSSDSTREFGIRSNLDMLTYSFYIQKGKGDEGISALFLSSVNSNGNGLNDSYREH